MWFYEALLSAVVFAFAGLFFKAAHKSSLPPSTFFFYLYSTGALVLSIYLYFTGQMQTSFATVVSGALVGAGLALGNSLIVKALDKGPISLTSPIINLNIVFLVLGSVVIYNEHLSLVQYTLIGFLILSILILPVDTHEKLRIKERSWYYTVVLASFFLAVRNGGLKITIEIGLNNNVVLFYSYAIPAITFFFLRPKEPKLERKSIYFGSVAGILSISGMMLYSLALSSGPASIVIPIFSTYNVFLVLGGYFLFGEQLSPIQKLSVSLMIVSSALLKTIEI